MYSVENKFEIGEECYSIYRKPTHYKCPICDSEFDEDIWDINYCKNCGSKLDWNDADYSYLESNTYRTKIKRRLSE